MKIAIISHTYIEPEHRKNIVALSNYADVMVVGPTWGPVLVFDEVHFNDSEFARRLFRPFRPFWFRSEYYILLTLDMGFAQFKPDIIQVEYNPWSLIFLQTLLCRALFCRGSRLVCLVKQNTYRKLPGVLGWVKDRVARFTVRHVDHFLAASHMAKRLCLDTFAFAADAISVIHHLGVDTERFAPDREKDKAGREVITVGYCGRLDRDKGVGDLVVAIEQCRGVSRRDIDLKLLGQGKLKPMLERRAAHTSWLEILPPVRNAEVADFLHTLDIFVLPARILTDHQEHDAHALLEALAVGVATIGARSGIIPEILGDGTGVLVAPSATVELAAAVGELADDERLRQSLGARGRRKAEQEFSLDRTATDKLDVYRELMS